MFYYLKGTVAVLEQGLAVLDCGGVGFSCATSARSMAQLEIGREATLYTYCSIREDAFDIYGFSTRQELECFRLLIGISGVGPKAAVSILSIASPEELSLAVSTGDEKLLTMAPGVGKKLAQRILLELKDRFRDLPVVSNASRLTPAAALADGDRKTADVAAALAVLGYTPGEIHAAMGKTDLSGLSTEDAVRQILKTSLS